MAIIVDDQETLWHKELNNEELIQVCDFILEWYNFTMTKI